MLENENVLNEKESVLDSKKGKKSKPKKQTSTIVWTENLKKVFKLVKRTNFWGRNKKTFKMDLPIELDIILEDYLDTFYNCFEELDKNNQIMSKKKLIVLAIITAFDLDVDENGEVVQNVDRLNLFVKDLHKHINEEELQLTRNQKASKYINNKKKKETN